MENELFKDLFKRTIDFDLRNRRYWFMLEKNGYPEPIFEFSKDFMKIAGKQIDKLSKDNPTIKKKYEEDDLQLRATPFIPFISIELTTTLSDKMDIKGAFDASKSSIGITEKGEFRLAPVITISVSGTSLSAIKSDVFKAVGHEMTHAYSIFMTLKHKIEKNRSAIESVPFAELDGMKFYVMAYLFYAYDDLTNHRNSHVHDQMEDVRNKVEEFFAYAAYLVSDGEQRAEMTELRNELETKKNKITDAASATRAILDSDVYKYKYLPVFDTFGQLRLALDNFPKGDPRHKIIETYIIYEFNKVVAPMIFKTPGKKVTNVNTAIKYLIRITENYRKLFIEKGSRMCQEIIDKRMSSSYIDRSDDIKTVDADDMIKDFGLQ